ncbi:hypothetical protein Tco_1231785 [Tanacetum coccineum]
MPIAWGQVDRNWIYTRVADICDDCMKDVHGWKVFERVHHHCRKWVPHATDGMCPKLICVAYDGKSTHLDTCVFHFPSHLLEPERYLLSLFQAVEKFFSASSGQIQLDLNMFVGGSRSGQMYGEFFKPCVVCLLLNNMQSCKEVGMR